MSEIIEKNKYFLVKSKYGSYLFNNRKTAEQLNATLNDYEVLSKQSIKTEDTLDRVQRKVIQLQMSLTIMQGELDKLKDEVNL